MQLLPLITCEHAGNRIPAPYRPCFENHRALLRTHRAYDAGALRLARDLAAGLNAPLFVCPVTRLLVDLNRSLHHPRLYSEITRPLPRAQRQDIVARYYQPYRQRITQWIAQAIEEGKQVLHIAAHSFTPALDGVIRSTDVGLLYDPARPAELAFCRHWKQALQAQALRLQVRMNYPYAGTADGFTVALRKRFATSGYLGLELEVNQKHVFADAAHWHAVRHTLVTAALQAWRG